MDPYFRAFREVAKTINSPRDLNEVLDTITRAVTKAMNVKGSSLMLLGEEDKTLEVVSTYGLSEGFLTKGPIGADKVIQDSLVSGRYYVIPECATDPRIQYPQACLNEGVVSICTFPVMAGHQIIGVLRLYTAFRRDFTPDEVEFMEAIAEQSGIVINRTIRYEQLKKKEPMLRLESIDVGGRRKFLLMKSKGE
jgi:GAF domain-containing protein